MSEDKAKPDYHEELQRRAARGDWKGFEALFRAVQARSITDMIVQRDEETAE